MRKTWMRSLVAGVSLAGGLTVLAVMVSLAQASPRPSQASSASAAKAADQIAIDSDDIGGVVTSGSGPEAGVWVIAETTQLPTKFRKIVVTDDQGRFVLPDLPKASYTVWVRGYGLVDSAHTVAEPGEHLALTAVVAPNAKAAAQYYPAEYWFAMLKVPPKSAFPMTASPKEPKLPGIDTQAEWVGSIKNCVVCHQMGNRITREISPSMGAFDTSTEAWDYRIRMGQLGRSHVSELNSPYGSGEMTPIGLEKSLPLFADWSDRIAKGELPAQAPPRPAGVERNVVISSWDVATPVSFLHDVYATDKRNPTLYPYGPVYGADYNLDMLYILDTKRNTVNSVKLPIDDDPKMMKKIDQTMEHPSLYWGDELISDEEGRTEIKNLDAQGRLWMHLAFRRQDNPAWCKEGSDNKFAKVLPVKSSNRQLGYYDTKTGKVRLIQVCFSNTHHAAYCEDKDSMYYISGNLSSLGWVNPRILDETGNDEAAQGWCPAYNDINGNGRYDKGIDQIIRNSKISSTNGYYITYNPVDGSVWYAAPGTPGSIVRFTLGSDPPETCQSEVYSPPFYNPKSRETGYLPRGIDVDRSTGLIWTGLAGSGQLASFDRKKCKVLTGLASFDPQRCVEGWTLYDVPGPQMKDIPDGGTADFLYGNWVDQFNTMGLGANVPYANGTNSDSILALMPDTHTWVVMRVPYPMGFHSRNMAGRIDDAGAGWKGRGIWTGNQIRNPWHLEGGKGMTPEMVHFQMRPNPLAN